MVVDLKRKSGPLFSGIRRARWSAHLSSCM